MPDITPLDGSTAMTDALPSQFIGKPILTALWRAFGVCVTRQEDALAWLQTAFGVDDATGVQLDALGTRADMPRLGGPYPVGESDAAYRPKIRAAMLRNRSRCTADDLRAMVHALLYDLSPRVQIVDTPPAAFVLAVHVSAPLDDARADALREFCVAAKAAGVGIAGLAWYTAPTFAWATFTDPPFRGFDDGTGNVGGFYARYIYP